MDTVTQVQNLVEAVCTSHSSDTIGIGMNPIITPPAA